MREVAHIVGLTRPALLVSDAARHAQASTVVTGTALRAVLLDESGDLRIDTAPGRARRRAVPAGPRTTRS